MRLQIKLWLECFYGGGGGGGVIVHIDAVRDEISRCIFVEILMILNLVKSPINAKEKTNKLLFLISLLSEREII